MRVIPKSRIGGNAQSLTVLGSRESNLFAEFWLSDFDPLRLNWMPNESESAP